MTGDQAQIILFFTNTELAVFHLSKIGSSVAHL
jgi:hypothetical protein